MRLRDYQQRAVDETRKVISLGKKKVLVVSPTGSGKSVIISEIFRLANEKGKKCLFMVHRRNLVTQIKETMEKFGLRVGVIMAGVESDLTCDVQVSTIQTFARRLQLDSLDSNRFFFQADLVVVDEAHRCCSKQYVDVLGLYADKVIIGFTGTPARSDGKGLGEIFDAIVDVVGVKELTEQGHLAEVTYYCPPLGINLDKVKSQCGDYQIADLGNKMSKPKLVGDVVENWLKYGQGRKTIVFAVNVKHSRHLLEAFTKKGIPCARLDAKSPEEERNAVFEAMENGDITVLINVLLYVEGMDCPEIGCVSFARPTKSLVLYRQGAGRGMRPKSNGGDLIFFDHGGVVDRHGFVDDEIEWSLDGKDLAWKKPKKAKKEKKPVKCAVCHKIFEGGSKCPDCGSELKSFGKDVETVDAELKEVKGKKATVAEKRLYLGMLKHWVRSKNYNPKMIKAKYRSRYGCWPHHSIEDVSPIVPDQAFLNLMIHEQIKYAAQKKRAASEKSQWI